MKKYRTVNKPCCSFQVYFN